MFNIIIHTFSISIILLSFLYIIILLVFNIKFLYFILIDPVCLLNQVLAIFQFENLYCFMPIFLINIISIIIFLILFFCMCNINKFSLLELLIYFKFICNNETLSCLLAFLPIDCNIKLGTILFYYLVLDQLYDFIYVYKSLSNRYIYTNRQFCKNDYLVRAQVVVKFVKLKAIDIFSSHQTLLSNSDMILTLYENQQGIVDDIALYYSDITDCNNVNFNTSAILLTTFEVINFSLFIIFLKYIKTIIRKCLLYII